MLMCVCVCVLMPAISLIIHDFLLDSEFPVLPICCFPSCRWANLGDYSFLLSCSCIRVVILVSILSLLFV